MCSSDLDQVVEALTSNDTAKIATASCVLDEPAQYSDPSVVKVVTDHQGFGIYFSRAPIPYARGDESTPADRVPWQLTRRHIGIYAYRVGYLQSFAQTPPCILETTEKLEQLRALWLGDKIIVTEAREAPSVGVDTVSDLELAIRRFSSAS